MAKSFLLDEFEYVRLLNDFPIRFLFAAETSSNLLFLIMIYVYPSTFLHFFFTINDEIDLLTIQLLYYWASWLLIITMMMFFAIFSQSKTITSSIGIIQIRRFLYWILLSSELFSGCSLILITNRTLASITAGLLLFLIGFCRALILFKRRKWFGTILIIDENCKSS